MHGFIDMAFQEHDCNVSSVKFRVAFPQCLEK